jgi:diaminopimelate epimerase
MLRSQRNMTRRFHKMHGLGNDFVIFDARKDALEIDAKCARAIADRRTGVGCDQLIILEKSLSADLKMRIFNADGGEVGACGNAARCVALLVGGEKSIETGGGIIIAAASGNGRATVDMGVPRFGWQEIPLAYAMDTAAMPVGWEKLKRPFAVNVGNPHIIFFVKDADAVDLARLGPMIEKDPLFPKRVNVNIASVEPGGLKLRVWERGAGLTQACGTGACAGAVAAICRGLRESPVQVRLPGGAIDIAWDRGSAIRMSGAGTYVYQGEIALEAFG